MLFYENIVYNFNLVSNSYPKYNHISLGLDLLNYYGDGIKLIELLQ